MKSNRQKLSNLIHRQKVNEVEKELLQDKLSKKLHTETIRKLQSNLEDVMKIDVILCDSIIKISKQITL